jgi:hypothetical protein
MFDQMQPEKPSPLAKLFTICGVGLLLGFGTCGIGALVGNERVTSVFLWTGVAIFAASLAGFVILVLYALGRAFFDILSRRK